MKGLGWLRRLFERITESDLYFRLLKRQRVRYRVSGSCKHCGRCCRELILGYRGKPIRNELQFNRLLQQNPEYGIFSPNERVPEDGILRFTCEHVSADNLCRIHERRPDMCRRYPDPGMPRRGGTLLSGCGYSFESDVVFADLLDEMSPRNR